MCIYIYVSFCYCSFTEEMKRSQTATTVMSEPSEPEEGGFPTYELRRSTRNTAQRNGTVKNIYARYVTLIN